MAIFGKFSKPANNPLNTTIISGCTTIKGQIQGESMVHMNGNFSGPINSTGIVSIGKSGLIEGDLTAKKLVVTGRFLGTADCEEIQILTGGEIIGQITCKILVVERGGFFHGENRHKKSPVKINERSLNQKSKNPMSNAPCDITSISEAPPIASIGQTDLCPVPELI